MGDWIKTLECKVDIQENGIIRLDGRLIGRLLGNISFNDIEDLLEYMEEEND